MKSATDNAEDLIKRYTRQANQARQAEITRNQRNRRWSRRAVIRQLKSGVRR